MLLPSKLLDWLRHWPDPHDQPPYRAFQTPKIVSVDFTLFMRYTFTMLFFQEENPSGGENLSRL